jgi:hypothetical protein
MLPVLDRIAARMILDFAITTGATAPLIIGATIIGARIVQAGGVTTGAMIAQMIGGPIICVAVKKKKIPRKRKKMRHQTISIAMIAE